MIIEKINIKKINPAKYNPRKNLKPGDPEYDKLKKSISEFDLVEPLIWNKRSGNLVGGHQRLKILQEMGLKTVDVSVVDLDEAKEKALNLALNKIQGDWDLPKLKDLLQELDTGELDMEITGFDSKEIEELMTQFHVAKEGLTDDDEIPDKVETICKLGDLWQLGNHRLLCGDATRKEDVERLMNGEKADMVFTDPPYGINLNTDFSAIMGRGKVYPKVIGDDVEWDFRKGDWFDCTEQFWFGAENYRYTLPKGGSWFVWNKQISEHDGASHTGSLFELCWSKTNHKREIVAIPYFRFYGMDTKTRIHPTQKPVRLSEWFIEKFSHRRGIISDLFGGSGSTLIACEKLDRRCFMMEIEPHYCDVIIQRWENFTGQEAVKL